MKLFPRKQTILFFDQKCFPKLNIFTTFEKAKCYSYQFYLFVEILKKKPFSEAEKSSSKTDQLLKYSELPCANNGAFLLAVFVTTCIEHIRPGWLRLEGPLEVALSDPLLKQGHPKLVAQTLL